MAKVKYLMGTWLKCKLVTTAQYKGEDFPLQKFGSILTYAHNQLPFISEASKWCEGEDYCGLEIGCSSILVCVHTTNQLPSRAFLATCYGQLSTSVVHHLLSVFHIAKRTDEQ